MSKKKSLFSAIEWNGRTLNVLGYIPAEELKKIAEDFENGIDITHEQVEIVDGELVRQKLMAMVGEREGHPPFANSFSQRQCFEGDGEMKNGK